MNGLVPGNDLPSVGQLLADELDTKPGRENLTALSFRIRRITATILSDCLGNRETLMS